jgi:phage terminase Nu1 subunit (DNA packaging protein)
MTQSAYARHRGCSPASVNRAVKLGILSESLIRDDRGRVRIRTAKEADAEWRRKSKPREGGGAPAGDGYGELRRRREEVRLRQAEQAAEREQLELAALRGELIPAATTRKLVAEAFRLVRQRLLAVPSRCRQRISGLKKRDMATIDALIREALEELADTDPETLEGA